MSWCNVLLECVLLNLQTCFLQRYLNLNWYWESNGLSWGLTSVPMPYLDTVPGFKPKTTIPNCCAIPTLPNISAFLCRELFSRISYCVFVLFFHPFSELVALLSSFVHSLCPYIYTMCVTERMCLRSTQ